MERERKKNYNTNFLYWKKSSLLDVLEINACAIKCMCFGKK